MDIVRREQQSMNLMALPLNNPPYTEVRGFPFYVHEMKAFNNYRQIGFNNGYQPINNFSHPMNIFQEDSQLNHLNNQKKNSSPKNHLNSILNSENQKLKPYINLLINTVTNLLNEGEITMKYLKGKTGHKTNGLNNSGINGSENSFYSSGSCLKSKNIKQTNMYETRNNFFKKNGNNLNENVQCENSLCKYVFNSNKDIIKIKLKGLKTQEKKLCKKCFEAVEKGHFCYYCNSIYRDDKTDSAKWVECNFCKKWEHFDCEITKGKRYSTIQELNEVKQYMCPICINDRVERKNMDNKIQKKLINRKRRGDTFDDQKCKKCQRKDLMNLKSEKCSELLEDIKLIDSYIKIK